MTLSLHTTIVDPAAAQTIRGIEPADRIERLALEQWSSRTIQTTRKAVVCWSFKETVAASLSMSSGESLKSTRAQPCSLRHTDRIRRYGIAISRGDLDEKKA